MYGYDNFATNLLDNYKWCGVKTLLFIKNIDSTFDIVQLIKLMIYLNFNFRKE